MIQAVTERPIPTVTVAQLDRNPHGIFRSHRPVTPVLRREDDSYLVIRGSDVERLAGDPRTRQLETERLLSLGIDSGALFDINENSMLFSNGATHRRRRAPLSRAFAHRLITALRPTIRSLANSLIDRAWSNGGMNFLEDFAAPIPGHMMSEILGLPKADIPQFTRWVQGVSRSIGFAFQRGEVPDMEAAAGSLNRYVEGLLGKSRATPQDDFLSSYAVGLDMGDDLSPKEAVIQIVTAILGGSDTTRLSMAIQTALLLQHREQWEAVCRDPALIPDAVLECLRFEPPVGSIPRFTVDEIELAGYTVPANRILSLSTMSAMRDPAFYAEPDSFSIWRSDRPRRHLAFGAGPHRCLGEVLARAELEEALGVLAERLPDLRLEGEPPTLSGHNGIRRFSSMSVRWS